jgi:hypothetical protein
MEPQTHDHARGRGENAPNRVAEKSPKKSACNAVTQAADSLWPWSSAINRRGREAYPGMDYGLIQLVGKRAAADSVRSWRYGHRAAPRWLIKLLWDTLQSRIDQFRAAQVALENYQHGPQRGASLVRYHKMKKAGLLPPSKPNAPSAD